MALKTPTHLGTRAALTIALVLAANPATQPLAGPLSLVSACAAYDLHLLTQVEDHGMAGVTEPDVLRAAMLQIVEARTACREGEPLRALRTYETIDLGPALVSPFHRVVQP